MAYLHCPQCRLTTFSTGDHPTPEACPRCDADLAARPRRLFRRERTPTARTGSASSTRSAAERAL